MNQDLSKLAAIVRRLLRGKHTRSLHKIIRKSRPADLAALFWLLTDAERLRFFLAIESVEIRAELLSEIDVELLPPFLASLSDEQLVPLLEEMSSDDTVDVLEFLPEERKALLLQKMSREEMDEAEELLRYDPETAGGIMVPEFFALGEETTCNDAIEALRDQQDDLEMVFYAYVINEHGHLVGVLSLRQVVIAPPDTPLHEVMETEVVRVRTSDDQESVAALVARYNLLALPVVDDTGKLVGIITVDDVIDVIREEATEDMLRMAGAGDADFGFDASAVVRSTRSRLPWLFASWIGGVLAGVIIHGYEDRLIQAAALAAFIPVIVGMAGNVGTQSLTIVTRGLALGQIASRQIFRVVLREVMVGLACGVIYGVLLGIAASVMASSQSSRLSVPLFGLTIGLALCAGILIAAFVGGIVPMILHRLDIDPAVATGPFVTTSVDILGIIIYFQFASLLLGI